MEECNDNKSCFKLTWDANQEKPGTTWEYGSKIGGSTVHLPLHMCETLS